MPAISITDLTGRRSSTNQRNLGSTFSPNLGRRASVMPAFFATALQRESQTSLRRKSNLNESSQSLYDSSGSLYISQTNLDSPVSSYNPDLSSVLSKKKVFRKTVVNVRELAEQTSSFFGKKGKRSEPSVGQNLSSFANPSFERLNEDHEASSNSVDIQVVTKVNEISIFGISVKAIIYNSKSIASQEQINFVEPIIEIASVGFKSETEIPREESIKKEFTSIQNLTMAINSIERKSDEITLNDVGFTFSIPALYVILLSAVLIKQIGKIVSKTLPEKSKLKCIPESIKESATININTIDFQFHLPDNVEVRILFEDIVLNVGEWWNSENDCIMKLHSCIERISVFVPSKNVFHNRLSQLRQSESNESLTSSDGWDQLFFFERFKGDLREKRIPDDPSIWRISIDASFGEFAVTIPHQFELNTVVESSIAAFKSMKYLLGSLLDFKFQPNPTTGCTLLDRNKIPRINVEFDSFSVFFLDDPFEMALARIFKLGYIEQMSRISRDRAFQKKVTTLRAFRKHNGGNFSEASGLSMRYNFLITGKLKKISKLLGGFSKNTIRLPGLLKYRKILFQMILYSLLNGLVYPFLLGLRNFLRVVLRNHCICWIARLQRLKNTMN